MFEVVERPLFSFARQHDFDRAIRMVVVLPIAEAGEKSRESGAVGFQRLQGPCLVSTHPIFIQPIKDHRLEPWKQLGKARWDARLPRLSCGSKERPLGLVRSHRSESGADSIVRFGW